MNNLETESGIDLEVQSCSEIFASTNGRECKPKNKNERPWNKAIEDKASKQAQIITPHTNDLALPVPSGTIVSMILFK